MTEPPAHGLLVLDKLIGMTSRAAVDQAARWFPPRTRIGHTGTLDPLATGVLILCVGKATRLTEFVQDMDKVYVAEIALGARSTTDDAEGPITAVDGIAPPSRERVADALRGFLGHTRQVPPAFSAAKAAGKRAYALARLGRTAELAPRTVRIDDITILDYKYPALSIEVRCGKGTYIRALARDLGKRLECGGYVSALARTRVGPFSLAQAIPLDADAETAGSRLLPLASAVADLPPVTVDHATSVRFRQGQAIEPGSVSSGSGNANGRVAVLGENGDLIGIARIDGDGRRLRPVKVCAE